MTTQGVPKVIFAERVAAALKTIETNLIRLNASRETLDITVDDVFTTAFLGIIEQRRHLGIEVRT